MGAVPSDSRWRDPLALLLVGLAANVVALVVQTAFYRLVGYEGSVRGPAIVFRLLFLVADGWVLAGLFRLVSRGELARGFLGPAMALEGVAVSADLLGLAATPFGNEGRLLGNLAEAVGNAEPLLSLGGAVLLTLALARANGGRVRGVKLLAIAVAASVVLALGFRFERLVSSDPRLVAVAWSSWLVEVARSVALLLLTWVTLRERHAGRSPIGVATDPYRGGGRVPERTRPDPPSLADVALLTSVAAGFVTYRRWFVVQALAAVPQGILTLAAVTLRGSRTDSLIAVLLGLTVGFVATVGLVFGVGRVLPLRPIVHLRRLRVTRALLVLDAVGLFVAAGLGLGALALGGYREQRDVLGLLLIAMLGHACVVAVTTWLAAGALGQLAERLVEPSYERWSTWTQGFLVTSAALLLGGMFAEGALKHRDAELAAVFLVVVFLSAVLAVGAALALHAVLVSSLRKAVLRYADSAVGP